MAACDKQPQQFSELQSQHANAEWFVFFCHLPARKPHIKKHPGPICCLFLRKSERIRTFQASTFIIIRCLSACLSVFSLLVLLFSRPNPTSKVINNHASSIFRSVVCLFFCLEQKKRLLIFFGHIKSSSSSSSTHIIQQQSAPKRAHYHPRKYDLLLL